MRPYRFLSALLAVLTAALPLAGCSQAGQEEQVETAPSPSVAETEAVVPVETENPAPPVTEYDGYEFRIGCCSYKSFIDPDELTEDRLGDAIFERNTQVEDLYKIVIDAYMIGEYQDVINTVKKGVQAGDDFADLVYTPIIPLLQSAYPAPELYINMRSLEKLDLNDGWWDPALTDEVTIRDFCPIVTGNAIITDELGLCTVMFNSTLFKTIYPGESLYDLAVEGSWTFDRMQRYAEGALLDLDGDGSYTKEDQFGIYYNGADGSNFTFAFGYNSLLPTDTGVPEINYGEALYDYYVKVVSGLKGSAAAFLQESLPNSYTEAFQNFKGNKTLFLTTNLTNTYYHFREMESDYGVMPYPKFDENQKDYHTAVTGWAAALAIPGTATDPERTGDILTAMAYYGDDLQKIMNDDILSAKIAREEAFAAAIEIMMDSKYYSVDWMLGLTGIPGVLNQMADDTSDAFYSKLAKNKKVADKTILKYYGG